MEGQEVAEEQDLVEEEDKQVQLTIARLIEVLIVVQLQTHQTQEKTLTRHLLETIHHHTKAQTTLLITHQHQILIAVLIMLLQQEIAVQIAQVLEVIQQVEEEIKNYNHHEKNTYNIYISLCSTHQCSRTNIPNELWRFRSFIYR